MSLANKMLPFITAAALSVSILLGTASAAGETPTPVPSSAASLQPEDIPAVKDDDGGYLHWMPDLNEGTGAVTLNYKYKDGDVDIDGAVIGITKIADLNVKYGDAKYTLVSKYSDRFPDISFDGMDKDELLAFSKEISAYIKAPDATKTTKWGRVKFTDLEYGLYLVTEEEKTGKALEFTDFEPFIVAVPAPVIDNSKYLGEWSYEVNTYPKTDVIRNTPTPTPQITPPSGTQTSDYTTDIQIYAVIGMISFFLIIAILAGRKREDKNGE